MVFLMKKSKANDKEIVKMFVMLFIFILLAFAGGMFIVNKFKPKQQIEYSNGFTFTKAGNFWYTTIKNPLANQEYNMEFRHSPSEVKDISVVGNPKNFFTTLQLNNLTAAYFTFNPTDNLTYMNVVAADMAKFLKVINGVTLVAGCTINETVACQTRPIITCENQKDQAVVIYVKNSNTPKISLKENCLTVEGTGDSLVKAYNKLLFIWYGVV